MDTTSKGNGAIYLIGLAVLALIIGWLLLSGPGTVAPDGSAPAIPEATSPEAAPAAPATDVAPTVAE